MMNSISKKTVCRLALTLSVALFASAAFAKVQLVEKWGRFEQAFKSGTKYENPFQQCSLKVIFVSPLGQTNVVDGFWDGGKTWRVRFSPDQPGRWTYRTSCSDTGNAGLNYQTGEFLCGSPIGQNRFAQHGPIHVAKDGHHFEHTDGTPFFWMADAAWNAPRLSTSRDWLTYTQVRAGQNFSAVQWAAGTGIDSKKHFAFTGKSRITIDPEYFRTLDEKVELMNRAGLLSVMAPLWGTTGADELPEEEVVRLIRYMNARWGAYDVAWLLTLTENRNAHWLRIGRDAFGSRAHGPVILFPGEVVSGFDEFRNENWIDAFGFGLGQNMNEDSLKWLTAGPLGRESAMNPARPFINVLPPLENGLAAQGQERITDSDVRRIAWWSLLLTSPAGVSYGAQDVATWNAAKQARRPTWELSLFLPGAKQMSHLAETCAQVDWWTLRPLANAVAIQPGRTAPQRFIATSAGAGKNLSLTYVPQDRNVEMNIEALPPTPGIQWLNPRTGARTAAVAVVGLRTCQLPTPDKGDWVLVVKGGK